MSPTAVASWMTQTLASVLRTTNSPSLRGFLKSFPRISRKTKNPSLKIRQSWTKRGLSALTRRKKLKSQFHKLPRSRVWSHQIPHLLRLQLLTLWKSPKRLSGQAQSTPLRIKRPTVGPWSPASSANCLKIKCPCTVNKDIRKTTLDSCSAEARSLNWRPRR